jgi:hypothetical protein
MGLYVRRLLDTEPFQMDEKKPAQETWRAYAERHDVTTRTLDRWVEDGVLPPPTRINGRKYINSNTEPRRDDANAA